MSEVYLNDMSSVAKSHKASIEIEDVPALYVGMSEAESPTVWQFAALCGVSATNVHGMIRRGLFERFEDERKVGRHKHVVMKITEGAMEYLETGKIPKAALTENGFKTLKCRNGLTVLDNMLGRVMANKAERAYDCQRKSGARWF